MKKDNENANNQKNNIVNVATMLFYDNGYKNTFLEQIAELCGITKPLIIYYFGSKAELAWAVHKNYTSANTNAITYKIHDYVKEWGDKSFILNTAVVIRLIERYYNSDEKAIRFILERSDDKFSGMFNEARTKPFYDKRYKLIVNNPNEIAMISRAIDGGSLAIKIAYAKGEFNCTFDEYIDFYLSIYFKLMNYNQELIDALINESKEIEKKVNYSFLPYFKIV